MPATWNIQTPTGTAGAVAIIQLTADSSAEIDGALSQLGITPVPVGRVVLRDLCGVDRGLVARWIPTGVHLMPHGGAAVLNALAAAIGRAGLMETTEPKARASYPEARSEVEAQMLAALARAASPLAVDLLLDQPRRHSVAQALRPCPQLQRLIDPALVVAIGPPNVGKSSLVNRLAGRRVAIVADEPGTTRDHVGVLIDMAGLVVRYIDTPGRRECSDPIEAQAARLATEVARAADLLLLCGDAQSPPPAPGDREHLTIALRADLGLPSWGHDLAVSAHSGRGINDMAHAIRDRLVPPTALADPRPWRFWV